MQDVVARQPQNFDFGQLATGWIDRQQRAQFGESGIEKLDADSKAARCQK